MAELVKKGSLGHILSSSQIITESDIVNALEEQKRFGIRFGEALVNLGVVTQEDIDWALSNQLDLPYIRLKKEMIDPEAIALVPADVARAYNLIPLICTGGELNVAVADPLNRAAVEAVEAHTGLRVNLSVALIREIRQMVDAWYGPVGQERLGFSSTAFSDKSLEAINGDISGDTLLNYLMVFIIQNRLSSLSLQPLGDEVAITGKRGGITRPIGTLAPNYYPDVILRLHRSAAIAPLAERNAIGLLPFTYQSRPVTFQVLVMPGQGGEYVTLRTHVSANVPPRVAELHLPVAQEAAFNLLARTNQGITFFASRNGQERCRFMDLMLEEADTAGKNVIILGEGPGRMNKRFPRIPLPHSEAGRARLIMDVLDHDPDVLVIEDATEGMPFTAACRAAMRGKLVLAGLEIRGTRNVLRHLLLYQQENYFLPGFVNGLVSFKGVQILCPACRTAYVPPQEEQTVMHLDQPPAAFYRTSGCDACGHSGFSTRRFLVDALVFDDQFLRVFKQSLDVTALDNYLRQVDYYGSDQEGLRLLMEGQVSPEEYIASVVL
ncbi:pilus assembly protein PilB [Oryzomonas japonica]|uniref:Pilus assembly protein PilB n=1 Tax=Oryzomonas japonica TaxID=2603858 RepID=A0A7J4ZV75_9BACT|nr:ATPase, T2SS/T4P/T4SS family [Oryzomonas japonica]KAB0667311.1 pilus assembly protein PilB [Oryzomonas japonica]